MLLLVYSVLSFFLFSSHIITLKEIRTFILPDAHVFFKSFCFKHIKNLPHDKNAKNKKKYAVSGKIIYRMNRREEQDGKKTVFFPLFAILIISNRLLQDIGSIPVLIK
jgi:hypothetical protein